MTALPAPRVEPARPHPFDPETVRAAIRAAIASSAEEPGPGLRRAVRAAAAEARACGARPEQVLVAMKHVWFSTPEVRFLAHGGDGHALLDRLISLTIDEFYRNDRRS